MTTLQDLKNALDQLLDLAASNQLLQLNSDTCERAYEAYVLGLCMKAVRNQGGTATLVGIKSGPNPNPVIFRGGPGSLASQAQDFCYVDCILKNRRFEIHLDVEYIGQSGANHEIDVSIFESGAAQDVRTTGRLPRTNKLVMAFECKFYTTTPSVSLARSFVGLVSDCGTNKLNGFLSNKGNPNLERYLSKANAPEPFTDLSPLNGNAEDRFVKNVEQVLRKWAAGR